MVSTCRRSRGRLGQIRREEWRVACAIGERGGRTTRELQAREVLPSAARVRPGRRGVCVGRGGGLLRAAAAGGRLAARYDGRAGGGWWCGAVRCGSRRCQLCSAWGWARGEGVAGVRGKRNGRQVLTGTLLPRQAATAQDMERVDAAHASQLRPRRSAAAQQNTQQHSHPTQGSPAR